MTQQINVSDRCIGIGFCTTVAPNVFTLTDSGPAEVLSDAQIAEHEEAIRSAIAGCPTASIEWIT